MKKHKTIIILIVLLIIIAIVVSIVMHKYNNNSNSGKVKITNTIKYNVEGDKLLSKIHKHDYYELGIASDEDELDELLEEYSYISTTDDDDDNINFKKNNYYLIAFSDGGCMYNLKPTDYKIKDKEIVFYVKEKVTCGLCAERVIIYAIPVPKKVTDKYDVDVDFTTSGENNCGDDPVVSKKPLLYLYPQQKTNIKVELSNPSSITTSYPKYNDGWNVVAYPNGDLYYNNRYYYGLYWEETTNTKVDFSEGFYVTKDNAIDFLEDKLSTIGLNEREANEFIMYWLPILEKNEQSLVYFELTNELQSNNKLLIEPKPDSLLRVRIHIKKVNQRVNIKEQQLQTFERKGFVAVEWGGTNH